MKHLSLVVCHSLWSHHDARKRKGQTSKRRRVILFVSHHIKLSYSISMPKEVWSSCLHSLGYENKFSNSWVLIQKTKNFVQGDSQSPPPTMYLLDMQHLSPIPSPLGTIRLKVSAQNFFFLWMRNINIITLHNTKQNPSKRLLDCIHRLKDTALGFYEWYERQKPSSTICYMIITHTWKILISLWFSPQLQNANKIAATVKSFTAGEP